jgi:ribosomal protein L11 methyltransferase
MADAAARTGSRYWELTVAVPQDASEGLTNFVWELGALGVVEEEPAGHPPRLRAFFPGMADTAVLAARVDAYVAALDALGFGGGAPARIAAIADEDWAEAWRAHFAPFAVGRRILIAPPWDVPAAVDGRVVLVIEPGRAFGTGQHGSTAGCLELVEAIVDRAAPGRATDIGTGSGILAIAAARLGTREVLAVDSDPDAVASATANVTRNALDARVRCAVADAHTLAAPPAPLVLANLLATAHRALGAAYARLVMPGGMLVLGGILDAEADAVVGALGAHGFALRDTRSVEGWVSLACEHAPVRDRR